ncbi:AAA family ATPase [Geobacter sulfurreducens]|uniref:ATP-dependent nuclease n=1 Tax=Geobacter sulfurreducens TaxID=35554 RepID=UPI001BDCEC93|nr:AAA family ATPase [Geobacter sulfurreducens]QVW33676.1 AAA family ATPase [Geobacter sulfurreducens]
MRLKSLVIKNFRAINGDSNKIEFGDNNILFIFGKNNIGKSSVLHAYQYFASPNQTAAITDFFDHNPNNYIVIEATFVKEPLDDDNFEAKGLNKWVSTNGEIRFKKTWSNVDGTAKKETFNPVEGVFIDGGFGGLEPILTNATPNIIYIEAMPSVKSLTDWLEKEIKNKLLKKLKDNHTAEYQAALTAIQALQEKVEGEDYLGKISDGANKYFAMTFPEMELKIRATPYKEADLSKAFEKDFSITIGKKADDEAVLVQAVETLEELAEVAPPLSAIGRQFDLHGHGLIRQAIINVLNIFKDSKENEKHIILFEEPELYLHPSNKRKFRNTLYEIAEQDNYQIMCVSHDPHLIDLSRPHTSLVRFVKLENAETVIYQAGDDIFSKDQDTKDRVQMLNRFNPNVCETFFADEVILVEGDTEAIVLRGLLAQHYPNREIFVLNTGSKNNIPFFIQVLSHFRIKQHIIHDSDERYLYEKGIMQTKKNGEPKKNSAWTLNQTIWDCIGLANEDEPIARRYVLVRNFEHSHGYSYDLDKGKPLSAYEYAKTLKNSDDSVSIVKFLRQIVGDMTTDIDYSQDYLEGNVTEPF